MLWISQKYDWEDLISWGSSIQLGVSHWRCVRGWLPCSNTRLFEVDLTLCVVNCLIVCSKKTHHCTRVFNVTNCYLFASRQNAAYLWFYYGQCMRGPIRRSVCSEHILFTQVCCQRWKFINRYLSVCVSVQWMLQPTRNMQLLLGCHTRSLLVFSALPVSVVATSSLPLKVGTYSYQLSSPARCYSRCLLDDACRWFHKC